jgi:hypothetical protein
MVFVAVAAQLLQDGMVALLVRADAGMEHAPIAPLHLLFATLETLQALSANGMHLALREVFVAPTDLVLQQLVLRLVRPPGVVQLQRPSEESMVYATIIQLMAVNQIQKSPPLLELWYAPLSVHTYVKMALVLLIQASVQRYKHALLGSSVKI